jgi:hypothetical protein
VDIPNPAGGASAVRLKFQNRLERGAFRVAMYFDARRERQGRLERYRAVRDLWRVPAGMPLTEWIANPP